MTDPAHLVVPDYGGACITNIVPAVLGHPAIGSGWIPEDVLAARQVGLLLIDGLGWHQLQRCAALAPTLMGMEGRSIHTVAPSTTAAALTSISTGVPPGEHGIVGYRIHLGTETLNALRWTTENGDARSRVQPREFQRSDVFLGQDPVVVSPTEHARSGFTEAHLDGTQYTGYPAPSALVEEFCGALNRGDRFVYGYYDKLDRIGHEFGQRGHFETEMRFVDHLVASILDRLPAGAALIITADHGQVHTGDQQLQLRDDVRRATRTTSGEARFLWLHAKAGRSEELAALAKEAHDDDAWVLTRDEVVAQGWLGPMVTPDALGRLGDVAVAAKGVAAFVEEGDRTARLIGRHGSLTAAEIDVPLLSIVSGR